MRIEQKTITKHLNLLIYVWDKVMNGTPFCDALNQDVIREFHISPFKKDLARSICESPSKPTEKDAVSLLRKTRERNKYFESLRNNNKAQCEQIDKPVSCSQNGIVDEDFKSLLIQSIPDQMLIDEAIRRGKEVILQIMSKFW